MSDNASSRRGGPPVTAPCGTASAARRHYRNGEPPCGACLAANRRHTAERKDSRYAQILSFDPRPFRNGIPETPGYSWRARYYPWAVRVIERAEAVHGTPEEVSA